MRLSAWRGLWASVNAAGRRRAFAEELRGRDGEQALPRPASHRLQKNTANGDFET